MCIFVLKEVIFRCCNGVLCAICLGFCGYRACFVRSPVRISTPILEGVETKNESYWKTKDFVDFLMEKLIDYSDI